MKGWVYRLRAEKGLVGHEQQGPRYAVVLQVDLPLSTVVVAPTSRSARPAVFRPEIDLDGTPTRVLLDHMRSVDISRLGDMAGRLEAAEVDSVNAGLRVVFGLV